VFDLDALFARYEDARNADPSLVSWAVLPALANGRAGGGSNAAIAAEFAIAYAKDGSLSSLSYTPAQAVLMDEQFGESIQALLVGTPLKDATPALI
jgi:hypothetical protein